MISACPVRDWRSNGPVGEWVLEVGVGLWPVELEDRVGQVVDLDPPIDGPVGIGLAQTHIDDGGEQRGTCRWVLPASWSSTTSSRSATGREGLDRSVPPPSPTVRDEPILGPRHGRLAVNAGQRTTHVSWRSRHLHCRRRWHRQRPCRWRGNAAGPTTRGGERVRLVSTSPNRSRRCRCCDEARGIITGSASGRMTGTAQREGDGALGLREPRVHRCEPRDLPGFGWTGGCRRLEFAEQQQRTLWC